MTFSDEARRKQAEHDREMANYRVTYFNSTNMPNMPIIPNMGFVLTFNMKTIWKYISEGNHTAGIWEERGWTKATGFGRLTLLRILQLSFILSFFLETKTAK